jgi:hypothetical protein
VLFPKRDLDGIEAGRIDLAFRRWDKPRVKAGGSQRTRIGVISFDAVKKVSRVSDRDARRAGYASAAAMTEAWAVPSGNPSARGRARSRRDGDLYRIELRLAGPDPRIALRESLPSDDELQALHARLQRMGEWTYEYLQKIADHPGVRAPDLAASYGRETKAFKLDVRKLKELGLTESLPIGYRISPRGEALLKGSGTSSKRA